MTGFKKDTKIRNEERHVEFLWLFDLRLATCDYTLVILLPRAFAQSYFVTSLLLMHAFAEMSATGYAPEPRHDPPRRGD